jgi:hypothetical protein
MVWTMAFRRAAVGWTALPRSCASLQRFASSSGAKYRFGATEEQVAAQNELVQRVLSIENAAKAERNDARIAERIELFKREAGDTGSPEVQGALRSAPPAARLVCAAGGGPPPPPPPLFHHFAIALLPSPPSPSAHAAPGSHHTTPSPLPPPVPQSRC